MKTFVLAAAVAAFVCGLALSGPASAAKRKYVQFPTPTTHISPLSPADMGSASGPGGF